MVENKVVSLVTYYVIILSKYIKTFCMTFLDSYLRTIHLILYLLLNIPVVMVVL